MTKWILLSVCWALSASVCLAQYQSYPQTPMLAQPGAFAPNMYNRQTQPLSPYLNLLRGGDPGINYYYGVRPGLQSQGTMGGMGQNNMNYPSQLQMGFLPTLQNSTDESIPLPKAGEPIKLGSSGHPITFNGLPPAYFGLNRFGLSTAGGGNMNRQFGGGTNQQSQAPAAYNKKSTSKK